MRNTQLPQIVVDVAGDQRAEVLSHLRSYNRQHAADPMWEPLTIVSRAADDTLAGGLVGEFGWRWLHVQLLWVAAEHRGWGLGRALLQLAEAEARSRDCLGVYLDSIDFQAPGFYVKQGYQVFGVLDDLPPGSRQTYFCKRLGIDVG